VSKVCTFASGPQQGRRTVQWGALAHHHRGPSFVPVQAKLAENVRSRRISVGGSPAILMGRIFDDHGNRMTPSHSNKDGVRYRYYVSHVLLQRREKEAGRVTRVPAIQLERLVVEAIRAKAQLDTEPKGGLSDRAAIDLHVSRIIVRPDSIDVELREPTLTSEPSLVTDASVTDAAPVASTTVISLPWTAQAFPSVKGVLHQPETKPTLKQETRDAILLAIAKARAWIDDVVSGRVQSFAEIAEREGKVERHIRLLTPLAFIPPRALAAIIDGTGPHAATVTALAQGVPYRWHCSPGPLAHFSPIIGWLLI
jgi:site-specific DNA recombinase